ncbi:MAG: hypothetical protein ACR2FG_09805 [Marmoricola sp.]
MSLVLIGKGLVVGAVAASALVAGGHTTQAADSSTASGQGVVCHRLLRHAPDQLKQDLRAARKLPEGEQRHTAVKAVRKEALAGHYGAKVRTVAEQRKQQRKHWRTNAPAQLKQDLRTARKLPAGDTRKAAVQTVRQSALDGTYGDTVKQRLEHRKAHREACQAQRQERKSQRQS